MFKSNYQAGNLKFRPQTVIGVKNEKSRLPNVETKFTAKKISDESVHTLSIIGDGERKNDNQAFVINEMIGKDLNETAESNAKEDSDRSERKFKSNLAARPLSSGLKKIPLTDDLKSKTQLQNLADLNEKITEDIPKRIIIKNLSVTPDGSKMFKGDRMESIEDRLTDLEHKFDVLVDLLHSNCIIKGSEIKIKLEEHKIEKLNSRLSMHTSSSEIMGDCVSISTFNADPKAAQVAVKSSDPTVWEEKYYEQRQKWLNMTLEKHSEESLKLNRIPIMTGPVIHKPPLIRNSYRRSRNPFGRVILSDCRPNS